MTLDDLEKLCDAAHDEVSAICRGKRWRMCVPLQPTDSDALIGGALRKMRKLILVAKAAKEVPHEEHCEFFQRDRAAPCNCHLRYLRGTLDALEVDDV